jgi:hypothetical protein
MRHFVEHIVLGTTANVVNNEGPAATVSFVGDDADVIEAVGKLPHYNVTARHCERVLVVVSVGSV